MAKKASSKSKGKGAQSAPPSAKAAPKVAAAAAAFSIPGSANFGDLSKMAKMLTPEQAFELYRANAKMALDVINAAIDGTAKLRKKQFEGEEEARAMHKKTVKSAAEASDAQSLMAVGQGAAQEALEKSMRYWTEMFDLIVEIQTRLFTLIEEQTEGMPGVKQAKAAMTMMPDLRQFQKVVSAMQGVVTSGGPAFESMQKVMGDFSKMAQSAIPGMKR